MLRVALQKLTSGGAAGGLRHRLRGAPGAAQLGSTLAEAVGGVRVWIVAEPGSALTLRAVALGAGLEDDEIAVVPVTSAPQSVVQIFCAHCRSVTRAAAAAGEAGEQAPAAPTRAGTATPTDRRTIRQEAQPPPPSP